MSHAPEQPAYVRPVFDPTHPTDSKCPLCWDNGLLKGGEVLAEGELFFVYVFVNEDGSLKDCFIAPKQHHPDMTTLPPIWGEEFGKFYSQLRDAFGMQQHNGYWNEGFAAGQRIMGHWHVRIDAAPAEGMPAYGMGLALLRRTFNEQNIA
jgi:hypothetical protein